MREGENDDKISTNDGCKPLMVLPTSTCGSADYLS